MTNIIYNNIYSLISESTSSSLPAKQEHATGSSDANTVAEAHGPLSGHAPRQDSREGRPQSVQPDRHNTHNTSITLTYSKYDMLFYYRVMTAERQTNTNKQNENEKSFYQLIKSYPSTVMQQPSRGMAGQPRRSRLRRPNRSPKAPTTDSANKPRNTHRGLRSKPAIAKRKKNRQIKRAIARRIHRASRRALEAPAQEPQPPNTQLPLKRKIRIATLNVRGINQAGKRKEIE